MTNMCITTQISGGGGRGEAFSPRTFFIIQGSEIASEISFESKQYAVLSAITVVCCILQLNNATTLTLHVSHC